MNINHNTQHRPQLQKPPAKHKNHSLPNSSRMQEILAKSTHRKHRHNNHTHNTHSPQQQQPHEIHCSICIWNVWRPLQKVHTILKISVNFQRRPPPIHGSHSIYLERIAIQPHLMQPFHVNFIANHSIKNIIFHMMN